MGRGCETDPGGRRPGGEGRGQRDEQQRDQRQESASQQPLQGQLFVRSHARDIEDLRAFL
jgi:hypothetical protein